MAITCRGLQLAVTQQHLDHTDIDLIFQQVGGKAVAQGVDGDPLVQFGRRCGSVTDVVELPGRQWVHGVASREQPTARPHLALGMAVAPPGAQQLEQ